MPPRVSRAALFALSAAGAALTTAGCSSTSSQPPYGGPVPEVDGGGDAADGSLQALYGAPVPDAATFPDVGGIAPAYGGAPGK